MKIVEKVTTFSRTFYKSTGLWTLFLGCMGWLQNHERSVAYLLTSHQDCMKIFPCPSFHSLGIWHQLERISIILTVCHKIKLGQFFWGSSQLWVSNPTSHGKNIMMLITTNKAFIPNILGFPSSFVKGHLLC